MKIKPLSAIALFVVMLAVRIVPVNTAYVNSKPSLLDMSIPDGYNAWTQFDSRELSYGYEINASNDDMLGGGNRAIGYDYITGFPDNLLFGGTITLNNASYNESGWARLAFVIAVDYGTWEDYIELDVWDTPLAPVQPGVPFESATVK